MASGGLTYAGGTNAQGQGIGSVIPSTVSTQVPGTLNATFPQPAAKTIPAPTVITAKPAQDNVAQMQQSSNQTNTDLAAHNASLASTSQTQNGTSTTPDATSATPDLNSQIETLLGNMGQENPDAKNTLNAETGVIDEDQQTVSDLQNQQNNLFNVMNGYSTGSVPLTTGEQAQVNNVSQAYSAALQQAMTYAASLSSLKTYTNASTGINMYSPQQAAGNLKAAINSGQARIAAVNSKIVDAQNKLTTALQNADYKSASDAYTQVGNLIKDRQAEISNINTAIDRETTQMQNAQKDQLTGLMDLNTISYQQKQQAIAQSTLDEKTKNDLATQADNLLKTNIAQATLALKTRAENFSESSVAPSIAGLPSVPITATGADPVAQQAFLANLPGGATGQLATDIKGLADYTINPADFTVKNYKGASGITRADAITLAKQFNPSYSDTNYPAAAKYMAQLRSTGNNTTGGQLASANKAIEHLTTFAKAVQALKNGSLSSDVNSASNVVTKLGNQAYQTKYGQAASEASIISNELPKYFRGSGMAESDIKTWENTINPNATPGDLNGALAGTLSLLSEQLGVSYADYQNALGSAPPAPGEPGSLMTAAAYKSLQNTYKTLQNEGVDVSGIDLSQFAGQPNPDPMNMGAPPGATVANNPLGI